MESLISITNSTITCSFTSNNQILRSDKVMYLTLYHLVRSDRNCRKNRRLRNLSSMGILRFLKVLTIQQDLPRI